MILLPFSNSAGIVKPKNFMPLSSRRLIFSPTKLNNLQKLQDRAITLIQYTAIKDRIPSAKISVNELIKLDQAMMVHKILNEQCPEVLKQKFIKRSHVSKYETRRAKDLQDTTT